MVAAVVARFADQQQNPPVIGRLLLQQIHGVPDRIQNRRATVSRRHLLQIAGDRVLARTKGLHPRCLRIEGHQRHIAAAIPRKQFQQRAELADLVELQRSIAPPLDAHHHRDRLRVQIVVHVNLLLDPVVVDREILRLQPVQHIPVRLLHQRRHHHHRRAHAERRQLGVRIGREILRRPGRWLRTRLHRLIFRLIPRLSRERLRLLLRLRGLLLLRRWLPGKWLRLLLCGAQRRGNTNEHQPLPQD